MGRNEGQRGVGIPRPKALDDDDEEQEVRRCVGGVGFGASVGEVCIILGGIKG